ncbi:hypothetical protein [Aquimarina algiphila]|uniref:hypothetical protein n=1 Tax=Aquimarina algiphila TaxID=2047982 RepID=UPI00232D80AB|nr:hypothetical protein [Aquimarina algiphila]
MKTLEESIEYTIEKKEYQTSTSKNSHFNEPNQDLKKFLINEKGRGSVALNFGYITTWYHWNFINDFVTNSKLDYNTLTLSTYYASECNNWEYSLGKLVETYDDATSLTNSVKHLAQMLYLGQKEKSISYGNLLLKMLYGKQYDGWITFPTHPWFMLELFCKWQGKELEQAGTRYPDSLGVYQEALNHWDTTDTQLLSDIVDTLTEFHIIQSDEDEQGTVNDENGDGYDLEFTRADYFIFPVEILMWLAIRRDLDLPDYIPSPNNKLMQMKINKLPNVIIPEYKDELVEKCKAKLKKDNPNIEFEL